MRKSRKLWRVVLATMIVLGLLSIAGLAFAQSSQNFDLGCWSGMVSAGGRIQLSETQLLNASIGQTAAGEANSGQYKLRAGYLQDWRTLSMSGAQATAEPAHLDADGNIFLPIIQNFVRTVRPCTYN
jgi:hypothetical protein